MSEKALEQNNSSMELLVGYIDKEGTVHKEFELKEMTGKDEELMTRPDIASNGGKVITALLSNCCTRIGAYEKRAMKEQDWQNIIRNLYIADRDYLFLKLRDITFGEEIEVSPECPKCGGKFTLFVDSTDIELRRLPDDVDPTKIPFDLPRGYKDRFTGEVTKTGTVRLPNGHDQEQLDLVARRNMGEANTLLISRIITSFGDGGRLPVKEDIREFGLKDREAVLKALNEHPVGPKLSTEVQCPMCGEFFENGISMVDFFK
jgi:hypothetical protein